MSASGPNKQPFQPEEDVLERHRDLLRERFPLPVPKPRKPRAPLAGVASLLLIALLFWLDPAYRHEQFATEPGQRRTLALADGSHLTLDGGTRVSLAWHLRSRRAELQDGQALFDVSRARLRPFQVLAGTTRVQVKGTLFNVLNAGADVQVTLLRGSVLVGAGDSEAHLAPGQQAITHDGRLSAPRTVDTATATAWQDGKLVFKRTPLKQALEAMQRYRGPRIVLDDPELADLPINGVFKSENVESLLKLLPGVLPVELSFDSDGTAHLQRRPAKK
ncbi:putative transmembrane sensor [Pseudomonas sp. ATCC 13867]|uniref:FecR family protein n=1 Tax=Pseudomonas sp. ATCC 13867 TaxID=1294143 RepID=UPI0002C4DC7F|nr:FecR domain-containing protein [Pseudomonas sp. ATCC 13867]AGI23266.1 putative transmembrane sensor [Pseudomonas sp. ATCC 13867]RFQ19973.1 DUF4974 domain-containing protein [Pseudomonas sp. ATCC 13867]